MGAGYTLKPADESYKKRYRKGYVASATWSL